MKLKLQVAVFSLLSLSVFSLKVKSQVPAPAQVKPALFEGLIVAGYVDDGAYINCAGPAIKFTKKPFSILAGLLPGLRIKKDNVNAGSPSNSVLTPSLGFGLTSTYKHVVLQLPLYYNAKTATKNGKWNPGIGLGYKF